MSRKAVFGLMLAVLVLGTLDVGFNASIVTDGTIYVRPDGSIDPATAPMQRIKNMYTLTDNMYASIVIEKDNITIDGNRYTVQGEGVNGSRGVDLSNRNDVAVKNMRITGFDHGIHLRYSLNNTLSNNIISNNSHGVYSKYSDGNSITANYLINNKLSGITMDTCSDNTITQNYVTEGNCCISVGDSVGNTIVGNTVTGSDEGIRIQIGDNHTVADNKIMNNVFGIILYGGHGNTLHRNRIVNSHRSGIQINISSHNTIHYNNFVENAQQVTGDAKLVENIWDDGGLYLCSVCGAKRRKGNYWSDYRGSDNGSPTQAHNCPHDGIGDTDTPHQGIDEYPMMNLWTPLEGDLNVDGIVDIFDVITIVKNFGKSE